MHYTPIAVPVNINTFIPVNVGETSPLGYVIYLAIIQRLYIAE